MSIGVEKFQGGPVIKKNQEGVKNCHGRGGEGLKNFRGLIFFWSV